MYWGVATGLAEFGNTNKCDLLQMPCSAKIQQAALRLQGSKTLAFGYIESNTMLPN